MVVRYCLKCNFHQVKAEAEGHSYCCRENCYSRFSKCLSRQALDRFIDQESLTPEEEKPSLLQGI